MTLEVMLGSYIKGALRSAGEAALSGLMQKRREDARDVMVDRLSKGKAKLSDLTDEDAAAITYRFMRAAEEGAARLNLKLLADVASGQDSKPEFYANDFLMWADILSNLRREEVLLLAIMHREAEKLSYQLERSGTFWRDCTIILESERKISQADADTLAASLLRTGLVSILGGLMDMGHAYLPTANLQKLGEMADIETYYMEEPYLA